MGEVFFHVDVNSAFLSWEAAYRIHELMDPVDLRSIASVIGGSEESRHGIVLAKSVAAKKYGIQTGEALVEARQKCPGLVVVPPDYPLYVECSRRLIRFLKKYSPKVEQYSIDEAFMSIVKSACSDGLIRISPSDPIPKWRSLTFLATPDGSSTFSFVQST